MKAKRCQNKACGTAFTPARPLQRACCPLCALEVARTKRQATEAKQKRQELKVDREKREAVKPRAKWLAECQAIVNKIVRLRDRHLGCCSCDRPASWDGQWHASHFRSVGAASALRINLLNIHKGCSICNNHLSGNIAGYMPRLVEKIGADRVDWLMSQNQLVRYDIPYLQRFKAVMGKRLKRMEKRIQGELA